MMTKVFLFLVVAATAVSNTVASSSWTQSLTQVTKAEDAGNFPDFARDLQGTVVCTDTCGLSATWTGSCGAFGNKNSKWDNWNVCIFGCECFEDVCCASDGNDCCDANVGAIVGTVIGIVAAIVIIVLLSCMCCSCCPCHDALTCKKKENAAPAEATAVATPADDKA